MLRYGDGSPFPFDDAFLDMLADAVEACTAMLAATARLERRRAEAEAVLAAIGAEERRLLLFERAVAAACGTSPHGTSTPALRAAESTRSAMATAVELSREQLKQISAAKAAEPSWRGAAQRVHDAAGRFFARRLLPGSRLAWAWDVSGPVPRAEAATQDARFRVVFDLDVPPLFRAPVRIDSLVPELTVRLPRQRWLRAPVEAAIPLGRCLLVAARHDDRGRELLIRKPDGSGWRIELPQDGQPSATALDRRGRAAGTSLVGEGELAPLLPAIDRELAPARLPRQAREVLLDGTRVTELEDTTLATRALLDEIGPTVRQIRQRSRVPGELSLKRDVASGVREELFVSRASLTAHYAGLPPELRRLLDDAGFGRGLTTGIAALASEQPAPAAAPAEDSAPATQAAAPVEDSAPATQAAAPTEDSPCSPSSPWSPSPVITSAARAPQLAAPVPPSSPPLATIPARARPPAPLPSSPLPATAPAPAGRSQHARPARVVSPAPVSAIPVHVPSPMPAP
ncbi:MAG TPA: hypothetical protein VK932_02685, partial [Kofleriaceae bacterium]|nr:hypothetical protein [Kofleriaceae bacterium]